MAKRGTPRTSAPKAAEGGPGLGAARLVVGLLALAFASGLLSVVQWFELIRSYDGVEAFCAIGERLDCATVWSSDFAETAHRWTGMPLAAWGLVWSVAALAAGLATAYALMLGRSASSAVAAARWVGAGGVVACVLFLVVSLGIGAVCITCLATYVLVALFAALAFRLPEERWLALSGLRLPAAVVLGAYLVLLYPGRATPTSSADLVEGAIEKARTEPRDPKRSDPARSGRDRPTSGSTAEPAAPSSPLAAFLRGLPGAARRAVVDALASYRESEPIRGGDRFGERPITGEPDAPVKIVDFVDVGCGHCAHLMDNLDLIRRELPGVPFSVETRYFPLDGACNDMLPRGSGDPLSTRCLGAKLLLCAQGSEGYRELKHTIFENHRNLSPDAMYDWAARALGRDRASLEKCVRSDEVESKLAQDVAYGELYSPRGTPLVVVNGREASPLPPFLYALILAEGDPRAEGFEELGM